MSDFVLQYVYLRSYAILVEEPKHCLCGPILSLFWPENFQKTSDLILKNFTKTIWKFAGLGLGYLAVQEFADSKCWKWGQQGHPPRDHLVERGKSAQCRLGRRSGSNPRTERKWLKGKEQSFFQVGLVFINVWTLFHLFFDRNSSQSFLLTVDFDRIMGRGGVQVQLLSNKPVKRERRR